MGSIAHHWLQEGIEKERARSEIKIKKEKITIAKNLIKAGLKTELIASSTGLTKEEIEKLK
ncbi:MAG TPA: transposase [Rickettsia endosymbiont of Pyrocoelia pectoralis]|nr:transposase [Rickettsia endosymbiont of Pyrocoelia pectoralis]